MKRSTQYLVIVSALVLAIVSGTAMAYAAPGAPGGKPGFGKHGLHGTVTAVGDSSVTVLNHDGESIVANVDADTTIYLVETQSEGELSDIEVDDNIRVRGQSNGDGSVDAQAIAVEPDGDRIRGRVTSVDDGTTINVTTWDSTATIKTDGDTKVYVNGEAANIEDISSGMRVHAYGELQGENSLTATVVLAHQHGSGGPGGVPGKEPGKAPGTVPGEKA